MRPQIHRSSRHDPLHCLFATEGTEAERGVPDPCRPLHAEDVSMIAQLFLSAMLFVVLPYAWLRLRVTPAVAGLSALAAIVGIYFVWFPGESTALAEFVGIG